MNLLLGDCLEQMKTLHDNSVDSIVTDPPYGLSFMGKKWDYDVPSVEIWREALRVLKPGGHLLSFGGTRTYHRMVVNIEDAGFEIRDQVMWIYGSGFPKSTDVSKRIDKEAGAERKVVGFNSNHRTLKETNWMVGEPHSGDGSITDPSTDAAKNWQGWGSALKPANEPICVARKPLEKGLTLAANVLKYGTGAINVDASRISPESDEALTELNRPNKRPGAGASGFMTSTGREFTPSQGRWPANIIFDEEAAAILDEQSGITTSSGNTNSKGGFNKDYVGGNSDHSNKVTTTLDRGSGGASRFFYVAKASKSERNAGLEGMPKKSAPKFDGGDFIRGNDNNAKDQTSSNFHPTVKPIKLMQYLIKLVTPPNGTILDPFMGSGSTGVAAKSLGFEFIGCEMSPEYFEIASKRIG